jgi:hypothetical protein
MDPRNSEIEDRIPVRFAYTELPVVERDERNTEG